MEYIKLSYHHLNFEDRTALMLESRKDLVPDQPETRR